MCSWTQNQQTYCMTHWNNAMIWCKCVMSKRQKWIQTYSLNNCMLWRTIILYAVMITCAVAFHENTFAVFELKEELQIRYMNMWELLQQLEYVDARQRGVVYAEIEHIRSEIQRIIDLLIQHDQQQHP